MRILCEMYAELECRKDRVAERLEEDPTSERLFELFTNLSSLLDGRPLVYLADIKKAFPTVDRELLFALLDVLGIPPKLIDTFKRLHGNTVYTVRLSTGDSSLYTLAAGVREGCPSSTTLFIAHHNTPLQQIGEEVECVHVRVSLEDTLRAPLARTEDSRMYHWHRLVSRMYELDEKTSC